MRENEDAMLSVPEEIPRVCFIQGINGYSFE